MRSGWTRSPGRGAVALSVAVLACSAEPGRVAIRIVDEQGRPTPARLEIVDAGGGSHVADDALPVRAECWTLPPPEWAQGLVTRSSIRNPYTGRTQFYADGEVRASLPPGRYRLRAEKGIEYRVARTSIEVSPGEATPVELALERWIDMPRSGWLSADDHLHITRLTPEDDARIARWMRAEDLHVANLLQMGTAEHFGITPQYAFGEAGAHRDGDSLLLAGQEHPRTHVLGHTITLGAGAAIDLRERYTIYGDVWQQARRLGGASGYAHWGEGHARDGLAIDAPGGLLSFVEVLQFDFPDYSVLYELLDLGVRIAPTAGTDYPCIPSLPGRERFYTRVPGAPTRESWIAGVRAGRTFVTNGPLLELEAGGAGIGDELALEAPAEVRVRGRVRFDPARDDVRSLELVLGGEVVARAARTGSPGEIALDVAVPVARSGWLALRASGEKLGELPMQTPWYLEPRVLEEACRFGCGASLFERAAYVGAGRPRPAAAHTAPIYLAVGGAPPEPALELLRAWIARLDALEARLADDRIGELVVWRPFAGVLLVDGVPEDALYRDRPGLLAAIAAARRHYQGQLARSEGTRPAAD